MEDADWIGVEWILRGGRAYILGHRLEKPGSPTGIADSSAAIMLTLILSPELTEPAFHGLICRGV